MEFNVFSIRRQRDGMLATHLCAPGASKTMCGHWGLTPSSTRPLGTTVVTCKRCKLNAKTLFPEELRPQGGLASLPTALSASKPAPRTGKIAESRSRHKKGATPSDKFDDLDKIVVSCVGGRMTHAHRKGDKVALCGTKHINNRCTLPFRLPDCGTCRIVLAAMEKKAKKAEAAKALQMPLPFAPTTPSCATPCAAPCATPLARTEDFLDLLPEAIQNKTAALRKEEAAAKDEIARLNLRVAEIGDRIRMLARLSEAISPAPVPGPAVPKPVVLVETTIPPGDQLEFLSKVAGGCESHQA